MAETQNSKQNVQAPQAGQTVIVNAIPGQDIVLEAAFDQAEVKLDNGNVVFEFANGGQVVLDFSDLGTAQAPNVVMPDGTILNMEEFLASLGESDDEPAAGPEAGADGSGGVGEYRDDAGNLIDGTDKLGVLGPNAFASFSVASLEADNALPSAGIVDAAADEDGMRISEMTPFDGNDDRNGEGDHPAQFAFVEGFLSYDFGGDGPAGTNPFVWSLNGLEAKGVTSQGYTLQYEVVDGVTLNAFYMGRSYTFDSPENGDGNDENVAVFQEAPLVKILVFTIEVTDLDTGAYRFELYRPLDHSDPGTEDDIVYNFSYTITDGTGDTAVGGVNMIVDDDSPIWKSGEINVSGLVVEEALSYKDGDSSQGSGLTSGNTDEASGDGLSGSLAALVSFGADGPGVFSMRTDDSELPTLFSMGEAVQYRFEDGGTLVAYVGSEGPIPEGQGRSRNGMAEERVVFSLTINADGSWFFDLRDQLDHVDDGTNSKNFDLFTGKGEDGVTSVPAIDFSSLIKVTDGDGDVLDGAPDGSFTIQVQDDIPKGCLVYWNLFGVNHDETSGVQWLSNDTERSSVIARFESVENPGDDPHVEGEGAIGYARSGPAIVKAVGFEVGADSPALASGYSLVVLNTESGLKTTEGNAIVLSVDDAGRIIGKVVGGENDGKVAFAVAIDGVDGQVFVAQYLSLDHPDDDNSNDFVDLGGHKVAVRYTVTDFDGDTVYQQQPMGSLVRFLDDGPSINVKVVGDESAILLTTRDEDTIEGPDTDSKDFSAVFTSDPSYGADGRGGLSEMKYALILAHRGVKDSRLDSDGDDVNLYKIGEEIVGSTASSKSGVNASNTVFKLAVDGAGKVTLTQYQEIDHLGSGSSSGYAEQTVALDPGLIKLVAGQTITDGDGDTDTDYAAIDLGGNIQFADDGPWAGRTAARWLDDEGLANGIPGGLGDKPHERTSVDGILKHDFGADGPGTISFAGMHGQTGTVGIEQVQYAWDAAAGTLTAKVAGGARDNTDLFTVQVNQVTGAYTVTLHDNVLHEAPGSIEVNTSNYLLLPVTISVLVDGDPGATLNVNPNPDGFGFGITSSVDGHGQDRFDEINHLEGEKSETMSFKLTAEKALASSAVVDLAEFYAREAGVGDERGTYELWRDGSRVQDAVAFQANSDSGNYLLAISGPEGGFDEIRLAALPGSNQNGSDSSDYSVRQVTFNLSNENNAIVDLRYTVTDGDYDTAEGTLRVRINDDMPEAEVVDKVMPNPQATFDVDDVQAIWTAWEGWDGTSVNPGGDEIRWGTGGAQSGYNFVVNGDAQTLDGVDLGDPFVIGTFTHVNKAINADTSITRASLDVEFKVTIGDVEVNVERTVNFVHDETTNNPDDGISDDDIVTIEDAPSPEYVYIDGFKYVLDIKFLMNGNPVSRIQTVEDKDTSFDLIGKLSLADDYYNIKDELEVDYGADGPGSLIWSDADSDGLIAGLYGTLSVDGEKYEYTLNSGQTLPDTPVTESFHYTVVDADGDSATSVLNIMLQNPIDQNGV